MYTNTNHNDLNFTVCVLFNHYSYIPVNNSLPILLKNVHCPTVKDPSTEAMWHILRCSHDAVELGDTCNDHSMDVGIKCGKYYKKI